MHKTLFRGKLEIQYSGQCLHDRSVARVYPVMWWMYVLNSTKQPRSYQAEGLGSWVCLQSYHQQYTYCCLALLSSKTDFTILWGVEGYLYCSA